MKKTQPNNGEVAVTIVRVKPSYSGQSVDVTDYTNPRITAVIPCWKDKSGKLTSVENGTEVKRTAHDDERPLLRGNCYRFPDGEELIYTRNGRGEQYFVPREIASTVYAVFGQ